MVAGGWIGDISGSEFDGIKGEISRIDGGVADVEGWAVPVASGDDGLRRRLRDTCRSVKV
jgi:hypothetical protein